MDARWIGPNLGTGRVKMAVGQKHVRKWHLGRWNQRVNLRNPSSEIILSHTKCVCELGQFIRVQLSGTWSGLLPPATNIRNLVRSLIVARNVVKPPCPSRIDIDNCTGSRRHEPPVDESSGFEQNVGDEPKCLTITCDESNCTHPKWVSKKDEVTIRLPKKTSQVEKQTSHVHSPPPPPKKKETRKPFLILGGFLFIGVPYPSKNMRKIKKKKRRGRCAEAAPPFGPCPPWPSAAPAPPGSAPRPPPPSAA